ncbi:MAG: AMP-binding protein [Acidobacteriaceae bacterium]
MNIADHIVRGSTNYPERIALLFEGQPITYRECDELSSKAASAFASAGVKAGDRVALFLPNIPEFVTAYLGALKLGAIAVSMNANLQPDEAAFFFADCAAKIALTTPDLQERIPIGAVDRIYTTGGDFEAALQSADGVSIAKEMEPHEAAAIVYTSGTTDRPKGATLSHGNIVRNIEAKGRYLGIRPEDRALLFMPLYHCFGQNAVLNAFLHAGSTVVLHRRFDFNKVMESITRDAVTMFFGVPTTYILLHDRVSRSEMAAVRYYFSAAAPLPLEIEERWARKFGVPIFQGYGLTETSPFSSYNHLVHHRPGSVGTPIEGVEMKIVDVETGRDAALGEKGEIVVRGHNVMLGYWKRPADTAKSIRNGWFHTGDIGYADPDGYFFIEDRLTDMMISGGVNVYPAEIENVLMAHAAVSEAAVYGMPEALLGEQVCADIVLRSGTSLSDDEIRAFCRQRLSPVKVPAIVNFTDKIPKGPTGKILKRTLRERTSASQLERGQKKNYASRDQVIRWIQAWFIKNLDLSFSTDIGSRISFADLGMDSILSVRLATELGDWAGCKIEDSAAWSFPSAEALAEHIVSRNGSSPQKNHGDVADLSDEAVEGLLLSELEQINR